MISTELTLKNESITQDEPITRTKRELELAERSGDYKYKTFRYVVHYRVEDYLRLGWHIAQVDLGHHRCEWSILMEWLCECKIVEPRKQ